jgi:hypothetical protein
MARKFALTVPLARDKARDLMSKDDKNPFGAILIAKVTPELPEDWAGRLLLDQDGRDHKDS